ncbi:MAG: RagB/SusD family nutrient uptake outer membrane protein [Chitinophagaceae bacterium]|nr:RagB/SusD family nutrient uptake outer membrane protein [Chitinophagaceae bacterium]
MKQKIVILATSLTIVFGACTKLDEKLQGELNPSESAGNVNVGALLSNAYNSFRGMYQDQGNLIALGEMSTDAMIGPTRGGDWDDNGAWRVLHTHRFDGDNAHVVDVFNGLGGVNYAATDLLRFSPTPQQAAEARFLRALSQYLILDLFDQVPYREPGESAVLPSKVRKGTEELTYLITELTAIIPDLPAAPVTRANKDAAKVLLMKCYLNKGAYANRATPTFDAADMQKVVTLADEVMAGPYSFATNYFDNFAPNNDAIGKENIFVQENIGGVSSGGIRSRWHMTMHYNQQPSGWNGFTSLSDFYNKFEASDVRRGVAYSYTSPVNGNTNPANAVNVGFLVGQQYNMVTGAALQDRTGAPLAFTPEVKIIEKGTNLEVTGIRCYKFPIDFQFDDNGNVNNDNPIFRLGDVMLMKAEALLRSGNAGGGLTIVNALRANRGASALGSLTLDNMLDERGREMYHETWRRQDLIRFGKFLDPMQEKSEASDPKYLLFPIPNGQLAGNPNLIANPGY